MKHILTLSMLTGLFLFAASLKSNQQTDSSRFKNDGYFTATIDGRPFDTRSYEKYTAELSSEPGFSKGEQGANLTFFGGNYYDQEGNAFEESLEFKYAINPANPTEITNQKLVFQFNNQKFSSVPGQTKIQITKMHYNAGKTALIVSGTFDAKMLEFASPGQSKPIIHIKGKMENINITIPAYVKSTASL